MFIIEFVIFFFVVINMVDFISFLFDCMNIDVSFIFDMVISVIAVKVIANELRVFRNL
jgi:hypothetical protein